MDNNMEDSSIVESQKKQPKGVKFIVTFTCFFIVYGIIIMASWSSIGDALPQKDSSLLAMLIGIIMFSTFGGLVAMFLPTQKKKIYIPISFVSIKIFILILSSFV